MKNKEILLLLSWTSILGAATPETPPNSVEASSPVNYSSAFQVEQGWNIFASAEYLLWVPGAQGLYFAQTGIETDPTFTFSGKIKRIHPSWSSGFRIGLGTTIISSGWDLLLAWTRFHASKDNKQKNESLVLWAHPDLAETALATTAKAKWHLNLDTLDFEWGRSSWFGHHFSLRPFIGARGAWVTQGLKNKYYYDITPQIIGKLHMKSDFMGGGPRMGCDFRYGFGWGISIYGLLSGALLYGEFDTDFSEKGNQFLIAKSTDHFNRGLATFQMVGGLRWDMHFCNERYHIGAYAGWEQNEWFKINQMDHFLQNLNSGYFFQEASNLTLQGLTLGGRFDF